MTKLKTLSDFQKESNDIFGSLAEYKRHKIGDTIFLNLKQEAIKWAKEWKKGIGGQAVIDFIKGFFDIKEEELK
jgi:hypothetical protein